jgi:glucose-6-phosphate isomerase
MRIDATSEWRALTEHHARVAGIHLRDLFAADPGRGHRLATTCGDLYLDYSKHRVTDETVALLVRLAERAGLGDRIDGMFSGRHLNTTEDRPVLHVALRAPRHERIVVDGVDVVAEVHRQLGRMEDFATRVRAGDHRGATGRAITTVVNIGIGGSDLGPALACEALADPAAATLDVRFCANVDGDEIHTVLAGLDPATTLCIVSSKSFGTPETLANARAVRAWCSAALGEQAVARHFVAVSAHLDRVRAFGIADECTFPIWDWVGGRFSVDSAIGLAVMLAIGPGAFRDLLAGLRSVDEHLRTAPFERNVPVLMGMLGVWYTNFFGAQTHAVVPYSSALTRLPAYLQQLEMESNGKGVTLTGEPVGWATAPVVWGQPGTNGQHAFFQLLHQGTPLVPVDLIGFRRPRHDPGGHHPLLLANLLAQAEALAFGRRAEEVRAAGVPEPLVAHRTFPGNRPSSVLLGERLDARTLGALIACYEHKVLAQGSVWQVNSFDQWGVELGKELAARLVPALTDEVGTDGLDSSTAALVGRIRGAGADLGEGADPRVPPDR